MLPVRASRWLLALALPIALSATATVSALAAAAMGEPPKVGDKVKVDFVAKVKGERDSILRNAQATGRLAAMESASWRLEYWPRGMAATDPPLIQEIPLQDFERLRIRSGRSTSGAMLRGALWGLVAGGLAAVIIKANEEDESTGDVHHPEALWALPAGAAIGAGIGATMTVDVWRDYPVEGLYESASMVKP